MQLKDKYKKVLDLGASIDVKDGYVDEKDGKLHIGGKVPYQYDVDRLWDCIKAHPGWETEIQADIRPAEKVIYGVYEVQSGDTLSKIARKLLGNGNRYMEIFELNKDVLKDPDMIRVGQKIKLPSRT